MTLRSYVLRRAGLDRLLARSSDLLGGEARFVPALYVAISLRYKGESHFFPMFSDDVFLLSLSADGEVVGKPTHGMQGDLPRREFEYHAFRERAQLEEIERLVRMNETLFLILCFRVGLLTHNAWSLGTRADLCWIAGDKLRELRDLARKITRKRKIR